MRFLSRKLIIVAGIICWSIFMISLGNGFTQLGIKHSIAASMNSLVRLDRDRLSGNNLGDYEPYEPESGNLLARGHEYYYSQDGNFGIGVWESKPGETVYNDLEYDELMFVLDGQLIMIDEQGVSGTYGEGEGVVLPKGWSGTLAVPEGGVRKIWVTYMGEKK